MLTALKDVIESSAAPREEVLGFPEYLDLVKREPWITRNTFQLLHDMLLSSGVERTIVPGKPIKHRYDFFEDEALVGMYAVFGQHKAKEKPGRKDRQRKSRSGSLEALVDPAGPSRGGKIAFHGRDQGGLQRLFQVCRR